MIENLLESVCANLVFHQPDEREAAAVTISQHVEDALQIILEELPDANVYLSGSLARGEPSLQYLAQNSPSLHSDLDFILVGNATRDKLETTERRLNAIFPGYRDTLYHYVPEQVGSLRSASARDFYLGMRNPLHESFTVPLPDPFVVEPTHALEFLVYQLIAVLNLRCGNESSRTDLPWPVGGMWQNKSSYSLHKLAVESLRAATCVKEMTFERVITCRAAYEGASDAPFSAITSSARVEEILSQRERWTGNGVVWSEELALIVHGALCSLLGKSALRPIDALEKLRYRFYDTDRLTHLYPYAAFIAFYEYFNTLNSPEISHLRIEARAQLCNKFGFIDAPASLASVVVKLRWDYVHAMLQQKDRREFGERNA